MFYLKYFDGWCPCLCFNRRLLWNKIVHNLSWLVKTIILIVLLWYSKYVAAVPWFEFICRPPFILHRFLCLLITIMLQGQTGKGWHVTSYNRLLNWEIHLILIQTNKPFVLSRIWQTIILIIRKASNQDEATTWLGRGNAMDTDGAAPMCLAILCPAVEDQLDAMSQDRHHFNNRHLHSGFLLVNKAHPNYHLVTHSFALL